MSLDYLKGENKYQDIINLPHHVSGCRPQMAISDRAAQFSPFAALTGYDDAIVETQRRTEQFIEIDENRKSILNEKLEYILAHKLENPKVTITYFQPDDKKEGGSYVSVSGKIKKIDEHERCILMMDHFKILLDFIYEIELEM